MRAGFCQRKLQEKADAHDTVFCDPPQMAKYVVTKRIMILGVGEGRQHSCQLKISITLGIGVRDKPFAVSEASVEERVPKRSRLKGKVLAGYSGMCL